MTTDPPGLRQTDGYGRCLPPCGCPNCGRPRLLAQKLVEAIGSVGPESAEATVERACAALAAPVPVPMELPDQSKMDMSHEHTRLLALAERWMVRARNAEAKLAAPVPACAPPDFDTFDIDVHACPCGHPYGDHEYSYPSKSSGSQAMVIESCLGCRGTDQ